MENNLEMIRAQIRAIEEVIATDNFSYKSTGLSKRLVLEKILQQVLENKYFMLI